MGGLILSDHWHNDEIQVMVREVYKVVVFRVYLSMLWRCTNLSLVLVNFGGDRREKWIAPCSLAPP